MLSLLLTSLAGCKVDGLRPIADADTAQPDASIHGVWRYRDKDELSYVHIGPEFSLAASGAGKATRIVIVDHKRNGLTDEGYTAYASRLGSARYLSVVQIDSGKPAGYLFVKYALADAATLRFASVDDAALRAAIKSGEIAGTIKGDGPVAEAVITADSAAIVAYLARNGAKLFTKWVTLTRVPER